MIERQVRVYLSKAARHPFRCLDLRGTSPRNAKPLVQNKCARRRRLTELRYPGSPPTISGGDRRAPDQRDRVEEGKLEARPR